MKLIPQEISLLVSSDKNLGASNLNSHGSSFEVQLDQPLEIPKAALNVSIEVQEATVWWSIPNIISGQNDL